MITKGGLYLYTEKEDKEILIVIRIRLNKAKSHFNYKTLYSYSPAVTTPGITGFKLPTNCYWKKDLTKINKADIALLLCTGKIKEM